MRTADRLRPIRGMTVTFKAEASRSLAGIPATIIDIWPRFRSGEYLVTVEFSGPVRVRQRLIRQLDAFVSELDPLPQPAGQPFGNHPRGPFSRLARALRG